jgi:hypothetical protein
MFKALAHEKKHNIKCPNWQIKLNIEELRELKGLKKIEELKGLKELKNLRKMKNKN